MPLDLLDTGVYAWLETPHGFGRPNAGVVVDADGITVIDTLLEPSQWRAFGDEVDALGAPVRRIVLTSSHIEFCGGTSRFKLAAVFGRRQASVHLDQPPNVDAYRSLYPDVADAFDDLDTRPVSHVVAQDVQLTPAVTVVTTAGQQDENLVAVVGAAGIVFAGAMCSFGVTPLCFQGNPEQWADELDRIVELAPVIVPGHGPIGGEEEVRELQGYLRAVVRANGDPDAIAPGPWDTWVDRRNDEINVERSSMLARGDSGIPPSMLRRAGIA